MKRSISQGVILTTLLFMVFFGLYVSTSASAADNSDVKEFVTRFYELCLSRDPDSAGLDGWVSALINGTKTGSDVAYGFVFSQEFINKNTTNEAYLQVLYEAFFNRQPDPAGLQGWFDALAGGSSREDVLNGFIYATEFAELCEEYAIKAFKGHITKTQREAVKAFVTRFYQLCLGRNPDATGLDGWANNLLNQLQTGADVANGFIYSQEFINKNTTNDEYLTILYKAFFNRDPDQAGWDGWLSELNAGKNRGDILDGFIYSAEFSNLCCEYGINAFAGSATCGEGGGGTNVEASKPIGPEGGTVEVSNTDSPIYGAKIIIPPGALSDMKTISIAKSDKLTDLSVTLRSAGEYVDFGPDGTVFIKPVTISLPYNDKNNDGLVDNSNISETDIKVLSIDETVWEWEELTITEIDETLNVISAETTHFSTKTTVIDEKNQTNKKKVIHFFEQLFNKEEPKKVLSGQFIGYAYQAACGLKTYIEDVEDVEDVEKPLPPVAMIGTDFGYSNDLSSWESDKDHNRNAIINYWKAGGLITISWHAENPWDGRVSESEDKGWEKDSEGNEFNLKDKFKKLVMALNGDNSDNEAISAADIWKRQLEKIAGALKVLKDECVIVLWRPFHEMNGRWFWWGQQDRGDFSALWQHMYKYFEDKGLDNLVWVYSPNVDASHYENREANEEEFDAMNPFPSEYYANTIDFDIIGLDKYIIIDEDGNPDNTINGYDKLIKFIRPIGLAEFGPCDPGSKNIGSCGYDYKDLTTLIDSLLYPKISFFHAWNDHWSLLNNLNSTEFLSNTNIITRHDLDLDLDNCPNTSNQDQSDSNGNGIGDPCEINAPTNLTATAVSSSQINLSWTASTVYVGITGYRVYRDRVEIGTSTSTSYNVTGLIASTEYCFTVSAYDAAGNESGQSSQDCATTTGSMTDKIAPSIPTIINVWPYGSGNLGIKWEGSTDDFGVSGYNIYRDGLKIGTSDMTSYSDSGLKDSTEYCYTVSAFDAAGNESGQSSQACDTTNTPVITWYKDADGDGYPADETPIYAVVRPGNDYFEESELISIIEIDTDDTDATIYPGADDINDYAQDIEKSYNLGDADLIMERISINVLNDGQDYNCEKQIYQWNFSNLEYEDYNYQVNSVAYEELDGKNIAHINRTETFTINGINFDRTADIALIFEDNKWKLYGNQLGHQNPEILVAATAEGHNKYEPINPKTNFNRFDSAVYIVAQLDHLKAGSTITCHWFAPNGTQMYVNSWDVDVDPGGYPNCANLNKDIATWWPIEGDEDWWSNYVGTWHADLKVDGVNLKRLEFTYQDNGGSGINPTIIAPIDGESNYTRQWLRGEVSANCEVEIWFGEYGKSLSRVYSFTEDTVIQGFTIPECKIQSNKKYTWQIRVRPIGSNEEWEIVSATFTTGTVVYDCL